MKQIGSAITTPPRGTGSETGTQHGGHGLATQQNSQAVAAWLAKQRPEDMDAAAVSRASSHGVGLRVRYELRFPSGPNGERLPSYRVAVGCDVSQSGDHSSALADLRNFMTPAPLRQIEGWLAELSVIVARRQDDAFADELRVSVYSARLSRFPADVVRSVLLGHSYRFWPTWEELEKRCAALAGPRAQMIAALERGPAHQEPERRPPTEDERRRIRELVDQMFPGQSVEDRTAAVDHVLRGNCMSGPPEGIETD